MRSRPRAKRRNGLPKEPFLENEHLPLAHCSGTTPRWLSLGELAGVEEHAMNVGPAFSSHLNACPAPVDAPTGESRSLLGKKPEMPLRFPLALRRAVGHITVRSEGS